MSNRCILSLALISLFLLVSCAQVTETTQPLQAVDHHATSVPPTDTAVSIIKASPTPIRSSTFEGVRVNFIYFEGFLITSGDQRILIDAIYKVHPQNVLKPILESQPPFDGIDLILATHEHRDHFDPEQVLQYLQDNPKTKFISNPTWVDAILALDDKVASRMITVDLDYGESDVIVIDDIQVEAIRTSHGIAGVMNLSFIIKIDDVTLFHTGDLNPDAVSLSDLLVYDRPQKEIDISLISHRLFSEKFYPLITEGIQATHINPMHFSGKPPSDFETNFPNISVLWEAYDSWVMP